MKWCHEKQESSLLNCDVERRKEKNQNGEERYVPWRRDTFVEVLMAHREVQWRGDVSAV